MRHIPPSVTENSFNCPHCGALAHQDWYPLLADNRSSERLRLPQIIRAGQRELLGARSNEDGPFFGRKDPFRQFPKGEDGSFEYLKDLYNMFVSQCFSCAGISIWVEDKVAYPQHSEAPPANPDLSNDIRRDYDEASRILNLSPRGAAALIRLAIQKLCKELGKSGKNINNDIGALVAEGLDLRVQKALDAVRVTGNNAVHPGQLDLRDDRATAESLFGLLNLIVDKMISEPKRVDEVYAKLPEETRQAIGKRDGGI